MTLELRSLVEHSQRSRTQQIQVNCFRPGYPDHASFYNLTLTSLPYLALEAALSWTHVPLLVPWPPLASVSLLRSAALLRPRGVAGGLHSAGVCALLFLLCSLLGLLERGSFSLSVCACVCLHGSEE